jgi:ribonuclease E
MELDMSIRMLIDAAHPEESRVAILESDRLKEFDFETTTKKQLKGNIYLAKVIRIEPSLQAAFVEFGGNRHGFLAFNEIHPDYYRVPVEDRDVPQNVTEDLAVDEIVVEEPTKDGVETLGGEDIEENETRPLPRPSRQYKIQEVLTRRQIMLVQVVKEERGGKGAALTTYLSLAGRYCVLMPNVAHGGGVSRKITNVADRKRLRAIVDAIELPDTMSLIVRTAGMARNKVEIKRDCDYLVQLWNDIREKTLQSVAPSLIYEESNLIKRAIRDYYNPDISEIWVEGEEGYQEARDFIRKLIPSHIKKIKQYKDEKIPLFHRYGVERQIDAMHNPTVQLKSGGYIVFGTTEALVAIDVNSGRATRERHIEETALKTNLEAAEEVARQLRLRDLAGLVVIDFIDMDESRNIESVERRLKDAMKHDRARVQVGRISPFGLLELSRQRLRPNIIESTSLPCQTCRGSGMIRSVESASLHVLRAIEEEAIQQKSLELNVYAPTPIALYILNQKRKSLQAIEARWKIFVRFSQDDTLIPPDYRIERLRTESQRENASSGTDSEKAQTLAEKKHPAARSRKQRQRPQQQNAHPPATPEPAVPVGPKPEGAPDLSTPAAEGAPVRHNPRKRYRKFDRNSSRPRGAAAQGGETAAASPQSPSTAVPPPAQEKAPNHPKPEARHADNAPKEGTKKTAPAQPLHAHGRKKTEIRKGWWQRLLE